ncbi:MAG: DUF3352 domain-containing protein [Endomicrobiia bacterium]
MFEFNNSGTFLNILSKNNKIIKEFNNLTGVSQLYTKAQNLDTLITRFTGNSDFFDKRQMYISLHPTGQQQNNYLFTVQIKNLDDINKIRDYVKTQLAKNHIIKTINFDNEQVFTITFADSIPTTLYMYVNKNICQLSYSKLLIENSIKHFKTKESLLDNPEFERVYKTSNKKTPVNLYVNFSKFPIYISELFNNNYNSIVSKGNDIASWMELDININDENLFLNGITSLNNNRGTVNYFGIFENSKPVPNSIAGILPANTSFFLSLGMFDFNLYRKLYSEYLKSNGTYNNFRKEIANLNISFDINVEDIFYAIIEKEAAVVTTKINENFPLDNVFAVFQTKGKNLAEERILGMIESYAVINDLDFKNFRDEIVIDQTIRFKVYRMPVSKIPEKLFGGVFHLPEANYLVFIDNYMVMGKSISSLKSYINDIILNKTLKKEKKYKETFKNLSEESNILLYIDVNSSYNFHKLFTNNNSIEYLNLNKDQLIQNFSTLYIFHTIPYQRINLKQYGKVV